MLLHIFYFTVLLCVCTDKVENRSLINPPTGIRSDVIVTKGFSQENKNFAEEQEQPGWIRRQLLRFGEMTSSVGNKLGKFSSRLSGILDKICEVVKTIIPMIAAVCHVGQFEFCGPLNEAPQELADALSSGNLGLPD